MIIANITKLDDSIEFYSPIIILSITGILFCCFYGLSYKKRVLINPDSINSSCSSSPSYNNRLKKIEENTNENHNDDNDDNDDELPSYSEVFN